jgi:hypothetical protein
MMGDKELLEAFYKDIHTDNLYRDTIFPPMLMPTRDYFDLLPTEYRKRAYSNLRTQMPHEKKYIEELNYVDNSFRSALGAFTWEKTPERREFWKAVSRWGKEGYETLPPIP